MRDTLFYLRELLVGLQYRSVSQSLQPFYPPGVSPATVNKLALLTLLLVDEAFDADETRAPGAWLASPEPRTEPEDEGDVLE